MVIRYIQERNVKTILLDSIRHCQLNQGLKIHAWVLMTNHLHAICSCNEDKDLGFLPAQVSNNESTHSSLTMSALRGYWAWGATLQQQGVTEISNATSAYDANDM